MTSSMNRKVHGKNAHQVLRQDLSGGKVAGVRLVDLVLIQVVVDAVVTGLTQRVARVGGL